MAFNLMDVRHKAEADEQTRRAEEAALRAEAIAARAAEVAKEAQDESDKFEAKLKAAEEQIRELKRFQEELEARAKKALEFQKVMEKRAAAAIVRQSQGEAELAREKQAHNNDTKTDLDANSTELKALKSANNNLSQEHAFLTGGPRFYWNH